MYSANSALCAPALKVLSVGHAAYVQDCIEEGVKPREFDPMMFISLAQIIIPLLSSCPKPPPTPPALPADLAAQGVTKAQWKDASDSSWSAKENYNAKKGKYNAKAVRDMARKVAERDGISIKEAKPKVIGGFESARTGTPEELALSLHNVSAMQAAQSA